MLKLAYLTLLFFSYTAHALIETHTLQSKVYETKISFDISLPSSYLTAPARLYPVIYVLHGQWDMPITTATLDIMAGEAPEFIVIGIRAKGQQLQPIANKMNSEGERFRQHLNHEFLPYIHDNYRIAPYSILLGHSNAGRFALEQLLTSNTLFNDYFVFSPSLEDGFLTKLATQSSPISGHLFLSIANEGKHMQTPFDEVTQLLNKQSKLVFKAQKYPELSHQSSKIVALVNALQFRFNLWQPSYDTKVAGFDSLMNHYRTLEQEFGFPVLPEQDDLIRLIAHFAIENNQTEIEKIIPFLLQHYPEGQASLKEIKQYLFQEGLSTAAKRIKI